ncbi:MAG: carotenoid 1,2-hydratase, partial [Myxococcota bacterium]
MTEYPRRDVSRSSDGFTLRRNQLAWADGCLELTVDDVTSPFPKAVRGQVKVFPAGFNPRAFSLDDHERHVWWPIAPTARVEVQLSGARWSGRAYLDSNWGVEPLERGFSGWNWSRSSMPSSTVIHYITEDHQGGQRAL